MEERIFHSRPPQSSFPCHHRWTSSIWRRRREIHVSLLCRVSLTASPSKPSRTGRNDRVWGLFYDRISGDFGWGPPGSEYPTTTTTTKQQQQKEEENAPSLQNIDEVVVHKKREGSQRVQKFCRFIASFIAASDGCDRWATHNTKPLHIRYRRYYILLRNLAYTWLALPATQVATGRSK
jgi:hypothetical protein